MSIPSEVIGDFSARLRERGASYLAGGKVKITQPGPGTIVVRVQGSQPYVVEIEVDDEHDDIKYRCTCPYFAEWDAPCKHIWAALLAADQEGLLGGAPPPDIEPVALESSEAK